MTADGARGFLEDIVAHPDDDTPRLVFADWLQDEGDADRAEFIRVQIERSRLPAWDARQVALKLREHALVGLHGEAWKAQLPSLAGVEWVDFRRGFVATAAFASFGVLRDHAAACWAAAPVEAVSVRRPRRDVFPDALPPIPGLRELSLEPRPVTRRELDQLAEAPLLSTLRALTLGGCALGVEGFRRLTASPHLGNLGALRVPRNSIGNGGVRGLYDAVSLTRLEELDLSEESSYDRYGEDPVLQAAGIKRLAKWPGMARLRSLKLSGNLAGPSGLAALLGSPRASGLKELVLSDNGLSEEALQEFYVAHEDLRLDVLDLSSNLVRDDGAGMLSRAPCLAELKVLALNSCEIEPPGAAALAGASFLGSLRRLEVNHNSFGPRGLLALLDKRPPSLHTLSLVNADLTDEGVARLAASAGSDDLLVLYLAHNALTDGAARALAASGRLRSLLVLGLNSNRISKEAMAALRDSSLGKRLGHLDEGPYLYDDEVPT
jgi:uncharacterized protein (TIGR02996 family)